jgi:hypothetical protein
LREDSIHETLVEGVMGGSLRVIGAMGMVAPSIGVLALTNRGIGKENGNDGLRVLNASGKKIVGVTERGIVNESGSTRYVVDSFSLRWFSHEWDGESIASRFLGCWALRLTLYVS